MSACTSQAQALDFSFGPNLESFGEVSKILIPKALEVLI